MTVNKVILVGNLGRDPEIRYTANQDAVANVTIATSETWKDKSGEKQERTEWHRVVFFRRLAEIVNEYLKKGSQIYIEGRLQTRKWQDQSGQDRYTTEIIADEMRMLGRRAESSTGPAGDAFKQPSRAPSPQPQASTQGNQGASAFDDFDDDIPF